MNTLCKIFGHKDAGVGSEKVMLCVRCKVLIVDGVKYEGHRVEE